MVVLFLIKNKMNGENLTMKKHEVDYGVKLNDTVHYEVDEFDGHSSIDGVVTEIHADHIIVRADDMNLWCDPFNDDMFSIDGVTLAEIRKDGNK